MLEKIAVALSGGVDSATSAYLLKEKGYNLTGFFMNLWQEKNAENKASSQQSLEAAKQVAEFLNIDLNIVDYSNEFKKQVVDYFTNEYKTSRTPNPCVMCNKFIKFGRLLKEAGQLGCDYLATGHYAQINKADQYFHLLKGKDQKKDQSYFLWNLNQEQLEQIKFPVGGLLKTEVRDLAKDGNLPVAERPDSQQICFIAGDYRDFLKTHIPNAIQPGDVRNTEGEVIGKHYGLPLYTIGQRKGFKVQSAVPLYVIGMNIEKNTLIVGRDEESEKLEFAIENINWILPSVKEDNDVPCEVRIRYRGPLVKAVVKKSADNKGKVKLEQPIRSITPGQSAVFYRNNSVIGGGVISS